MKALLRQRCSLTFFRQRGGCLFCVMEWPSTSISVFWRISFNVVTAKCFELFFYLPYLSYIHEKVMYCYVLDGKSGLAWELLFPGHLPSTSRWGVQLSALPKDTTSELAGLFSTTSRKCQAPSREAIDTIFKSLLV